MRIVISPESDGDTFENLVYNVLRGFTVRVKLEGNENTFDAEITADGFRPLDNETSEPTGEPVVEADAHAVEEVYVY